MKLEISSNILRDGLNKLLTVVDKKSTRPILTNSLISVSENTIELVATDLEVSAKVVINNKNTDTGSFCINTKNFYDILKELPNSNTILNIDKDKNILDLKCENIDYSLLITKSEEFPKLTFENIGNTFQLKSKIINSFINKISHAISTDETRLYLNGIYIQQMDSKLRTVAIDGHRLALFDIIDFNTNNSTLSDGIIIPRKGINELKKISDIYPEDVLEISADESFIFINANNNYFLSVRLIAREYPKYQTIIPQKTSHTLLVDKDAILDSVKRIRLLSNEKTNGVRVSINKNEMIISANHPSLGQATESVAVNYNGDPIEIGFNAKYMLDTLSVLTEGEIVFEFNNELSPVIVRTDDLPNFLGIIMPLKL